MVVSYDLLYELEAVLLRDKFRRKLTVGDVLEYVLWIREGATLVEAGSITPVGPDPDDDYLVNLASESQADYLVSGDPDLQDLVMGDLPPVLTPRQFLEALERGEDSSPPGQ